jgi:hypothetical protein
MRSKKPAELAVCFTLVSFLTYSSTVKFEATYSSEASFEFQHTTWRYILEDKTLQTNFCSSRITFE